MSKLMRALTTGVMVLTISATGVTAFADTEISEATTPRGALCDSATKAERLELKKERLEVQVKEGLISQEDADAIIKAIEEHQATCDGTGSERIGQKMGAKFGSQGKGLGNGGLGQHDGNGKFGQNGGRGLGLCVNQ